MNVDLKQWTTCLLLCLCIGLSAQQSPFYASPTLPDTIPFILTEHNNLSVEAVINELDTVQLMFHTAASGITLIAEASARLGAIEWREGDKVKSWGGENEARYSNNNTLQIGSFRWDSLVIWENERSGPETDGKFGPHLFAGKAIEINFDNRQIIIHSSLPENITGYEKLPLHSEDGFMFIEAISRVGGKDYPNRFLIHTGYGGSILYADQFVKESEIGSHINITSEQSLKDSYGNTIQTKKGELPYLSIGQMAFENISVGFFEGSIGRQQMSVMGGEMLRRFNLIIHPDRTAIYVAANRSNHK